ncbi:MAG: Mov34/MPN/PAD-1 family protein [Candidatus Diapherotrites archaeon]
MFRIKKAVIESVLIASMNCFPNEFFALLGGEKEKELIDELVIVPAVQGNSFVSIREDLIPFDSRLMGSVHSHPSRNAFPSKADLRSFSRRGLIHLIVSSPYDLNSINAYDFNGKRIEFGVIE